MFLSENLPGVDKTYESARQQKLLDTLLCPVAFRNFILFYFAGSGYREI